MQRHRAILHLFECTTPTVCPCDISDAAICKDIGRYCTYLNTQYQFCPCDISDAAICKEMGRYCTVLKTQQQVCPCDISDAAICNDLGDIVPF